MILKKAFNHLKGKVQTVAGIIDPEDLGSTLMHEHILCDVTPPGKFSEEFEDEKITLGNVWEANYRWCEHPGNSRLNQMDVAVRELRSLNTAGCSTIVDMSSIGMKRDPAGLKKIAAQTGLHIVMGCGYYVDEFLHQEDKDKPQQVIEEEITRDILDGADGTSSKAGIIGEIGCSGSWTAFEKRSLAAAVEVQKTSGAAINVHPFRNPGAPEQIVRFIAERGGDPSRTIVSHIDRTVFDATTLLDLAESGCAIEYDFFGIESSFYPFQEIDLPNDGARLRWIRLLIDRGHLGQILISQDICTKARLVSYGGHGYSHLFRNVVPMMRRRGFTEEEIQQILVHNPRRLLTFS
jgi:phosphotriesterase-related protein